MEHSENTVNTQGEVRRVVCKSAGQGGKEIFTISVGRHVCGHIMDGVGLACGDRGTFIVEWADFERAYQLNKALREKLPPPCKSVAEFVASLSAQR